MLFSLSGLLSGLLTCVYLPPDREEAGFIAEFSLVLLRGSLAIFQEF